MTHDLNSLFAASGVQKPEDTIGFLLWRVAHRHQREVDRVLAPLGLTHLQFVLIVQTAWLGRDGAVVTQAGLADYGKVSPMQLSSVLKTLSEKGLVVRRPSRPAAAGRRGMGRRRLRPGRVPEGHAHAHHSTSRRLRRCRTAVSDT